MLRTGFCVAVLGALAAPVAAYTVKASVECTDIVREDGNESYREMNKWWLLGYFTGRNYSADSEAGKAIDDENIYQMALDFCRNNQSSDWDDAAIHVYDRLD